MSKRRVRNRSVSTLMNRTDNSYSESQMQKSKPIFGASTARSFYIPQNNQHSRTIDMTQFNKSKVFNKNISFFRDNFNQNDSSLLPFMSTLRQHKRPQTSRDSQKRSHNYEQDQYDQNGNKKRQVTQTRPFSVSMKRTMNQLIPKQIFDTKAKQTRLAPAYYRWHNKSGRGIKNCVQFECGLRDYNMNKNPEQNGFFNLIKPIKYIEVQPKVFQQTQLICPRQSKLFRINRN